MAQRAGFQTCCVTITSYKNQRLETDHSAITLHLNTEDLLQPKAPGFWKFNNSLLDYEDFTSRIHNQVFQNQS